MRLLAILCVLGALITGLTGLGLGIYSAEKAANNSVALRTLLLNGKTASAISAKKTAREVKSLEVLQKFDHRQTVNAEKQAANGQATLKTVIREVETHLDATIQRSVTQAAEKVAKEFGR